MSARIILKSVAAYDIQTNGSNWVEHTEIQSLATAAETARAWARARADVGLLIIDVPYFAPVPREGAHAGTPRIVESVRKVYVNPDEIEQIIDGPYPDATEAYRNEKSRPSE